MIGDAVITKVTGHAVDSVAAKVDETLALIDEYEGIVCDGLRQEVQGKTDVEGFRE